MTKHAVEIVGAGSAGLSAALAVRASGAAVTVYEKRPGVGARFSLTRTIQLVSTSQIPSYLVAEPICPLNGLMKVVPSPDSLASG